jgi:hypothetical protein
LRQSDNWAAGISDAIAHFTIPQLIINNNSDIKFYPRIFNNGGVLFFLHEKKKM